MHSTSDYAVDEEPRWKTNAGRALVMVGILLVVGVVGAVTHTSVGRQNERALKVETTKSDVSPIPPPPPPCDAGHYRNRATGTCHRCPVNFICPMNVVDPIPCSLTEYQDAPGQLCCIPCPASNPHCGPPPIAIGRRYNPEIASEASRPSGGISMQNGATGGWTAGVDGEKKKMSDGVESVNEWGEKDSSALGVELEELLTRLSGGEREEMATFWIKQALGEHASVASFAQNTLDLMALGAPPQLLLDAHRAGMDEIHHAQISFEIASAFAGQVISPGKFPEHTVHVRQDWQSVALATAQYGAIEETMGAVYMAHRAGVYRDVLNAPILASYLDVLVEDEMRHSQLAWDTLEWIGGKFGKSALASVLTPEWWDERRVAAELAAGAAPCETRFDVVCLGNVRSVVNGTDIAGRDSLAWSHVVEPMTRGLFGRDVVTSVSSTMVGAFTRT